MATQTTLSEQTRTAPEPPAWLAETPASMERGWGHRGVTLAWRMTERGYGEWVLRCPHCWGVATMPDWDDSISFRNTRLSSVCRDATPAFREMVGRKLLGR